LRTLALVAADVAPQSNRTLRERISKPHVWVTGSLLLVLVIVCVARKKRPQLGSLIEVMAYGAATWGAASLLGRGADLATEEAGAWESIIGGVVLGAAAIMGLWDSLKKI
jgi:hypothetical protein